jgi:DNA polymerase elongation subunit (family B)
MAEIAEKLKDLIECGDVKKISVFMKDNNLILDKKHKTITYANNNDIAKKVEFLDQSQHVRKIKMNSLFGSELNLASRFNDHRIGQSITLSGRLIVKHMSAYINQLLTGKYDYVGETILYNDTDSAYFTIWPIIKNKVESGEMEWNADIAIKLYNEIAEKVNNNFPSFMKSAFNCSLEDGAIIKCGREIVASKMLLIVKKRYAAMMVDKDGIRYDVDGKPGKMKVMGLDLRRSDTPAIVQKFLKDTLLEVLTSNDENVIVEKIKAFKKTFKNLPPWEMGSPKRGNRLTFYKELIKEGKGNRTPGHVRGALNWNKLCDQHHDKMTGRIADGMKLVVVPLKENNMGMKSIAYPTDEKRLPEWFKKLPFDTASMMKTVVEKRIENLLSKLPNWKSIERRTQQETGLDAFFI